MTDETTQEINDAAPEASAASAPHSVEASAAPDADAMRDQVRDALRTIFDPEIPVNIVELGLIYGIEVDADSVAHIEMTLTAPNCPAAQSLPAEVKAKVEALEPIKEADVKIVWEPAWDMTRMTEAARLQLGFM